MHLPKRSRSALVQLYVCMQFGGIHVYIFHGRSRGGPRSVCLPYILRTYMAMLLMGDEAWGLCACMGTCILFQTRRSGRPAGLTADCWPLALMLIAVCSVMIWMLIADATVMYMLCMEHSGVCIEICPTTKVSVDPRARSTRMYILYVMLRLRSPGHHRHGRRGIMSTRLHHLCVHTYLPMYVPPRKSHLDAIHTDGTKHVHAMPFLVPGLGIHTLSSIDSRDKAA